MAERTKLQMAMSNVNAAPIPLSYAEERAGIVEEGHRMLAQAAAEAERIALNQAEAEIEAAAHEQARLLAEDRARAMEAVALTLKVVAMIRRLGLPSPLRPLTTSVRCSRT